jgi:spore germination cell wall hydrolase CwlJ-like protein
MIARMHAGGGAWDNRHSLLETGRAGIDPSLRPAFRGPAMRRSAKTWAGAAMSLALGATVPAQHPVASPFPRPGAAASPRGLAGRPFAGPAAAPGQSPLDPRAAPQAQLALAFNAAVPVARGPLLVAAPFAFAAPVEDMARAIDCLAAAEYYEAGRGIADQRAVAQVVLNRVRHRSFPSTVCGVVFEGSGRQTGCQFTFTCDGALARRDPSPEAWEEARRVATGMLLGQVEPTVGLATHYHTDWVSPAWDREMDKIAVVRTHLFYRWRGAGGAPGAFDTRHPGGEPRIPLLARLSPAHRGPGEAAQLVLPQAAAPETVTAAAPVLPGPPVPTLAQSRAPAITSTGVFLATLPAGARPDSFPALAEARCNGLPDCRFIAWTDAARTPRALPMPGSSVDAIAFTFVRRRGVAKVQWDCGAFARQDPAQCIRGGG